MTCRGGLELGLCSNKMADESQNMKAALSEIARQANILLQSYRHKNSLNLNSIERVLVEPSSFNSPRQPGLQSGSSSSSTTTRPSTSILAAGSSRKQSIPQALRQRFPTLASTPARSLKIPSKGKRKTSSIVHKDIILLPNPDQKAVPTHRSRISLENQGFVVHEFPIDKAWGEEKLRFEIKKIFPVLDQKASSFSFVKACYGEIVVPKIADGVSMDATRVLSIAQQSCIYLRPDRILEGETEDLMEEISDSELEKCPWDGVTAGEERPCKQLCTGSLRNEIVDLTEGQRPPTSSHQGKSEQQVILQEMFPSAPEREIKLAVEVCSSLHEAADFLAESSSVTEKENPVMKPKCTLANILLELKQKMYSSEDRKKIER